MAVTDEEIIRRLRVFKGSGTNLSRTAANRIEKLRAALQEIASMTMDEPMRGRARRALGEG